MDRPELVDGALEVPVFETLSQENPVHFLLTLLLNRGGGVLSAHYVFEEPFPIVYRATLQAEPETILEMPLHPRIEGLFRNWLASMGKLYMDDQLYGGCAFKHLSQKGQRYRARFYMSNDTLSGFWFQIFAHPEAAR